MINQMKGDDCDESNDGVGKEQCERVSASSVESNVGNDGADANRAHRDTDWFSTNAKLHLFEPMGVTEPP
jgi:hypothetical protein